MKGETLNINFSSLSLEIYLRLLSSVKNASNPEEKSTFLLISFLPFSININMICPSHALVKTSRNRLLTIVYCPKILNSPPLLVKVSNLWAAVLFEILALNTSAENMQNNPKSWSVALLLLKTLLIFWVGKKTDTRSPYRRYRWHAWSGVWSEVWHGSGWGRGGVIGIFGR